MASNPINVLFLCTGNSARSILAEAILNQTGKGRYQTYRAGSHPNGKVHPERQGLLQQKGIATSGLRSKSWDEFARAEGTKFDCIITVCNNAAAEVCSAIPGQPARMHWDIPDPAAVHTSVAETRAAFEKAYSMLAERIATLTHRDV
jgi:arsenate reductase